MNDQQPATKNDPTEADARAFVENIQKACGTGRRFVFRGVNENFSTKKSFKVGGKVKFEGDEVERKQISSSLYRFYKDKDIFNPFHHPVHIEKELVEEAKRFFPAKASKIEVLTEIQHYRGKTTLIDFSYNLPVALFFACAGEVDSDGEVILLRGVEQKKEISYENIDKGEAELKMRLIEPSQTQQSSARVKVQHSVFLHAPKGYVEEGAEVKVFVIEKELKRALLTYLKRFYNLSEDTIYNDIFGFIESQKTNQAKTDKTSQFYFYQGNARQSLKDYEGAIADYDKAIELKPNFKEAYLGRGAAKGNLKKYEEALADYDKAIELNPNFKEAYLVRGAFKGILKKYEEALADYNKAIALDPQFKEAYFSRGVAKFELKRYTEALADYNKAIALDPQFKEAYVNRANARQNLKDYEGALADFDKAIELDPQFKQAYFNRGNAKADLKDYEGAIADFNKAIKLDPDYKGACNNRGNARKSLRDYKGAIADYDRVIELDPKLKEAYLGRGLAKVSLERYEEALADFDKAIELDPQFKEAYLGRGVAKFELKRYTEAIADYNKAIELDPYYKEAYLSRGNAKGRLGRYEKALADFNKAIELDPQFKEAYFNRGNAKYNLGLYSEAVANYKVALRLDPEYKQARNNLQVAIKAGGDPAAELGAEEEILPTSKSKLKSKEAYLGRGVVKWKLGSYTEAIADFDKAIELDPQFKEAYLVRGYAKQSLGKAYEDAEKKLQAKQHYQAALSDFEKATELNFRDPALAAVKEELKRDLARLVAELDEGAPGH